MFTVGAVASNIGSQDHLLSTFSAKGNTPLVRGDAGEK
jgi:hypothetical protein